MKKFASPDVILGESLKNLSEQTEKPGKATIVDVFWMSILMVFTFVSRMFFLDMGFGRADAWRVAVTGKFWVEMGEYFPSRPPGFPLVEIVATISYAIFGSSPANWIFTNLLTCLVFMASVIGVWLLARKWGIRYPFMVASVYAFAPLNWVYSIETIDYLWMTAFIIFSLLALESGRKYSFLWAGILLGIATAARFFAGFEIIPLLILAWYKRRQIKDLVVLFISWLVVSLAFYVVVFMQITDWTEYFDWFNRLNIYTAGMAELEGNSFKSRFLMPASGLVGPLASIIWIVALAWGIPVLVKKKLAGDRGIWACGLLAFFIMVPYLWHLHPNYWIPATGFLLMLLAQVVNPKVFFVVGVFIFMANFPWWQQNIEGLRVFSADGGNEKIEQYSKDLEAFQNETVFSEMTYRQGTLGSVERLLEFDMPENWVVMVHANLQTIKFLLPEIEEFMITTEDGGEIGVWGYTDHGPKYLYLLSPGQIEEVIRAGYEVIYIPGVERLYYANYGVLIQDVEGVKVAFGTSSAG